MVTKSDAAQPSRGSHLFMLRLWLEDLGCGQTDWRGKVQHVNSGEARYFRDWPTLEAFVEGLLGRSDAQGSHTDRAEEPDRASGGP
jgi:hypothetical protein